MGSLNLSQVRPCVRRGSYSREKIWQLFAQESKSGSCVQQLKVNSVPAAQLGCQPSSCGVLGSAASQWLTSATSSGLIPSTYSFNFECKRASRHSACKERTFRRGPLHAVIKPSSRSSPAPWLLSLLRASSLSATVLQPFSCCCAPVRAQTVRCHSLSIRLGRRAAHLQQVSEAVPGGREPMSLCCPCQALVKLLSSSEEVKGCWCLKCRRRGRFSSHSAGISAGCWR